MKILKKFILFGLVFCGAVLFADGGFTTVPSGDNYWTQRADHPIRIEVIDTSYVISPAKGAFAIGGISPDFTKLTFNHHWPSEGGCMNFVLFIDGTYYSFASYPAFICGTPIALYGLTEYHVSTELIEAGDSSRIITKWQIPVGGGYVEVNQILTPVIMTYGVEAYGTAKIHYQILNNDFMSHNIGLKLLLDVKVGNSDSPDIIVAGSYTASCQIYSTPMPAYWIGISDPSGVSTVARGTLRGADATPPDYFLIGDNWFFMNYPWINTTFGCEPDSAFWAAWSGTPTADVGVIYQWNPSNVGAGESYDIITYYGFYDFSPDSSAGIIVFPIIPTIGVHDCELDTIVEFITLISQEDPAVLTYINDTICVSFTAPVEVDSVFWNEADTIWGISQINDTCVVFDSLPVSTTVNLTWVVHIPPELSDTGYNAEFCYHASSYDAIYPTDSCFSFTVPRFSRRPANSELLTPCPLFVNCTTFTIAVEYETDEELDFYSILPKIAGIISTDYVDISGLNPLFDTFYVHPPGTLFTITGLDSYDVVIPPIEDIHDCSGEDTIECWVHWDDEPPIISNREPPDMSILSLSTPTIGFTLIDSGAGIDLDSIQFSYQINEEPPLFLSSSSLGVVIFEDEDSVRITYTLPEIFGENTVRVSVIRAIDNVVNCSPNTADTVNWTFFIQETSCQIHVTPIPPITEIHDCEIDTILDFITLVGQSDSLGETYFNDTVCVSITSPISVSSIFWDEADSIWGIHQINDTCVVFDSLPADVVVALIWKIYIPSTLFVGFDAEFCIYANSEDACGATDTCLSFTIPHFLMTPPIVELLTTCPLFVNCTTFTIAVEYDEDEGIDLYSILPRIAGITSGSYVDISGLAPMFDTFYVHPPGTLFTITGLDSYDVVIPPLEDIHGCSGEDTIECWVHWDDEPPYITEFFPPESFVVDDSTTPIFFILKDDLSGIDPASIRVDILYLWCIDSYDFYSPEVTAYCTDPECKEIFFGLEFVLNEECEVDVCLVSAGDMVETCEPNESEPLCWTFFMHPSGIEEIGKIPRSAELAVAPNPFNSSVSIELWLPEKETGKLDVIDCSGRLVETLFSGTTAQISQIWRPENIPTGTYSIIWNGKTKLVRDVTLVK